jgi:hypothetical protein
MKYDSDDALDRALFALPLEEPPGDLRASILTATIYRPAPVFKPWEIVTLATIAAIVAWLAVLVVLSGGALFVHSLQVIGAVGLRTLSNTATLLWLAAGGATAIWLSLFTGFQPSAKGVATRRR